MIGRYPIGTMGFGTVSEYSRMRIPSPPQNRTTFIASPPSADRHLGNGDDELDPPFASETELTDDLVLQVPGQDQDDIRLGLEDLVRWEDRDVRTREESSVLVRVPVDREVEE